jgi:hypothetical protein
LMKPFRPKFTDKNLNCSNLSLYLRPYLFGFKIKDYCLRNSDM